MQRKELPPAAGAERLCYDAARVRILLDYRPALRQRTGVGQYVHQLASALQVLLPATDSLLLFSSSWKDRLGRPVAGAATADLRIPVQLLNLAWHRLEMPPVELLTGPVDVAHSFHPLLMPARHAAQVVTVHDLHFLDHPERSAAEIRRDYPLLTARHARRADLVVTNSNYTATQVATRLHVDTNRILVCRPGAPTWTARRVVPAGGPVLFVGTIEPRKNLPRFFAAYARLVRQLPDAPPLVLAGGTTPASPGILAALDAHPELRSRVRHVGYVSDDERYRLYCEASLLVLPSLEEGFGLPALEAMQVGLPVVASARGALPEVVGDAGALVDPLDEEAMAAAMRRVLVDAELRSRYAAAGQVRARTFSWGESASRLAAAYREAVMRRRRDRRS